MNYYIQNRYQDSDWQFVDTGEPVPRASLESALTEADRYAADSILYGMVRVIDDRGTVYRTWSAGETAGKYRAQPANNYGGNTPIVDSLGTPSTPAQPQPPATVLPDNKRVDVALLDNVVYVSVPSLQLLFADMQIKNLVDGESILQVHELLKTLREYLVGVTANTRAIVK